MSAKVYLKKIKITIKVHQMHVHLLRKQKYVV